MLSSRGIWSGWRIGPTGTSWSSARRNLKSWTQKRTAGAWGWQSGKYLHRKGFEGPGGHQGTLASSVPLPQRRQTVSWAAQKGGMVEEWNPSSLLSAGEESTGMPQAWWRSWRIWHIRRAGTSQCGEEKAQENPICTYKYLMRVKETETTFSQWCTVARLETIGTNWNTGNCFWISWNTFAIKVDTQDGQRRVCLHAQNPSRANPEQPAHTSSLEWARGQEVPVLQECSEWAVVAVWSSSDYQSSTENPIPIFTEEVLAVAQTLWWEAEISLSDKFF